MSLGKEPFLLKDSDTYVLGPTAQLLINTGACTLSIKATKTLADTSNPWPTGHMQASKTRLWLLPALCHHGVVFSLLSGLGWPWAHNHCSVKIKHQCVISLG